MIFLIKYDLTASKLLRLITFEEKHRDEAYIARLQCEKYNTAADLNREVVLLEAENWEALDQTYGRYFYTLEGFHELLRQLKPPPPNAEALDGS